MKKFIIITNGPTLFFSFFLAVMTLFFLSNLGAASEQSEEALPKLLDSTADILDTLADYNPDKMEISSDQVNLMESARIISRASDNTQPFYNPGSSYCPDKENTSQEDRGGLSLQAILRTPTSLLSNQETASQSFESIQYRRGSGLYFSPTKNSMVSVNDYISYFKYKRPELYENDLKELSQVMMKYYKGQYDNLPFDEWTLLKTLVLYKSIESPEKAMSTLSQFKDQFSFAEKLDFAASFGKIMSDNYDDKRKDGAGNATGVVTMQDIFQGFKNGQSMGVCRDISVAQAQALDALGVSAYTAAYTTPGSAHIVTVVQDPKDRDKVYTLNYSHLAATNAQTTGTSAISFAQAGTPSVGLKIRIFDHHGKPVTTLPTFGGDILRKQASTLAQNYFQDPFLKSERPLAEMALLNDGKKIGNIFIAQDSKKEQMIMGVASGTQVEGKYFKAEIGGAYSYTDHQYKDETSGKKIEMDQHQGYLTMGVLGVTPDIVSPNGSLATRFFAASQAEVSASMIESSQDKDGYLLSLDGGVEMIVGNETKYKISQPLEGETKVALKSSLTARDVRELNWVNPIKALTISPEVLSIENNLKHHGDTVETQLKTGFAIYKTHQAYQVGLEVSDKEKKYRGEVTYESPIQRRKVPVFLPGSTERIRATAEQSFGDVSGRKSPNISVTSFQSYTYDIDLKTHEAQLGFKFGIGGKK